MISVSCKGDWKKTDRFFEKALEIAGWGLLDKYGKAGVDALREATPMDSGLARDSWDYEIIREKGSTSIVWTNSDVEGGCNVVLLLQYGHGTRGGTYVEGRDFINPAMKPVFDKIAEDAWKEVTRL